MVPIITQHPLRWGKNHPLENLEKQSSKIRVIKGEAPTISRRSPVIYLKCNAEDCGDGMMAFVDFTEPEGVTSEKH